MQSELHALQMKAAENNIIALREATSSEIVVLQQELRHTRDLGSRQISTAEAHIVALLHQLESARMQEQNCAELSLAQINAYAVRVSELQERLTEVYERQADATEQARSAAQQQLVQLQIEDSRLRAALHNAQNKIELLAEQQLGKQLSL